MSSEKASLQEFKAYLAERLQNAGQSGSIASKLGFLVAGQHWLVDLSEINEVVRQPDITPVPWTKPWFAGLTSIRGTVYGCSDLAAYLQIRDTARGAHNSILVAHPRFGINAALCVERALGLRNPDEMTELPGTSDAVPWFKTRWQDPEGQVWIELSMEKLVAAPEFLDAGL